jgi:dienelactone hydrolase
MKREVEFRSENPDEMIRADLYTPDEGDGPWPVVVMGGGWCYVKELIMPEYAKFFLDAGCAALIFDYRHLGASDGEPRQQARVVARVQRQQPLLEPLAARDVDADVGERLVDVVHGERDDVGAARVLALGALLHPPHALGDGDAALLERRQVDDA